MKTLKLDTWHPINGEWVHIVQYQEGSRCRYYTNGKYVASEPVENSFLAPIRKPVIPAYDPMPIDQIGKSRST